MELHVGIDVGGTFTDFAVNVAGQNRSVLYKVASTPSEPDRAIVEGLAALAAENGFDVRSIVRLSHGTTVGTNALIQRRCGKVAVVTTEGFRDVLEIARQTRPRVYDVHLDNPAPLVPRRLRFEVRERRRADGAVHVPLDEEDVRRAARELVTEKVDCVVVCFLHSHAHPQHERRAVEILRRLLPPEVYVSASSSVYPEFREYERFSTAVLNGALLTVMNAYLDRFTRAVADLGVSVEPKVSQSAGGLMSIGMARNSPVRSALSGPAAGIRGAAYRAAIAGHPNCITLDVGGTSSDVGLLHGATARETHDRNLAGFPLRLPALDVNAVGAGGGSIAWIDRDGLLKVGPHSAGASPGPACYGLGGEDATVTDANVVLGRLNGDALLDGRMPIRRGLADRVIATLAGKLGLDPLETALGIVRVACATIVKAIRTISVERGHDPAGFSLFAFGGAGPLHAADVARELDMRTILVPPNPGILCAEGLLTADLVEDFVFSSLMPLAETSARTIDDARRELATAASAWFEGERIPPTRRKLGWTMELRYKRQNFELSVPFSGDVVDARACAEIAAVFHAAHERNYGFSSATETIEFVNLKLKAIGELDKPALPTLVNTTPARPRGHRRAMFRPGEWLQTPIYRREALARGQVLTGPAIIEQMDTTVPIVPGDSCAVDGWGNLIIRLA